LTGVLLAEHTVCNMAHPWRRLDRQGGAL